MIHMKLHGKNIIGGEESGGAQTFSAFDPARGEELGPPFAEATVGEIDRALELAERAFHPSTVVVSCGSRAELEDVARALDGHLTATIHATGEDLAEFRGLVGLLEDKVGRLIFNGFPTGVEVSPAMHHGGPYPATTDVHFTSVGTAAIQRFARPVCYQNFPPEALPAELQNINRRRIWRLVDNQLTQEDC